MLPGQLPSQIILVGTVHRDPEGYVRSLALLKSLKPDLVLVELSPFGLAFRKSNQRLLQKTLAANLCKAARTNGIAPRDAFKHPEIRAIRQQISLPFEYRAARAYSRKTGAKYRLVDSSCFSRTWIASWPELIAVDNLTVLLSDAAYTPDTSSVYALAARRILEDGSSGIERSPTTEPAADQTWSEREHALASNIVSTLAALKPGNAVYLGGWIHLTTGGHLPTLRDILGIERSRCLLLHDKLPAPQEASAVLG